MYIIMYIYIYIIIYVIMYIYIYCVYIYICMMYNGSNDEYQAFFPKCGRFRWIRLPDHGTNIIDFIPKLNWIELKTSIRARQTPSTPLWVFWGVQSPKNDFSSQIFIARIWMRNFRLWRCSQPPNPSPSAPLRIGRQLAPYKRHYSNPPKD